MKKFFKSLLHALGGVRYALLHEQNLAIEFFCALFVIAFSFLFDISKLEWFIVIINIGIVFTAELFNTAIENLCNMIHKETHPVIKIVKDVAAGAVLITSITAFICGCIIFFPILFSFFKIFLS
jgi:diacylglycerol kinase (ATP)